MILCDIVLLPLAEKINKESPEVVRPGITTMMQWPAKLHVSMLLLVKYKPPQGYFPEPDKIIIICQPEDRVATERVLNEFNFRYKDGYRYVGGFTGTEEAHLAWWLEPQLDKWIKDVRILSRITQHCPQTTSAGLSKSLQQEWQYNQQVLPKTGPLFTQIEDYRN